MSNHETLDIPDGPCEDESFRLGGDRLYGGISIVLHPLHIHHLVGPVKRFNLISNL